MRDNAKMFIISGDKRMRSAAAAMFIDVGDERYRVVVRESDAHKFLMRSHCMLKEFHCLLIIVGRYNSGTNDRQRYSSRKRQRNDALFRFGLFTIDERLYQFRPIFRYGSQRSDDRSHCVSNPVAERRMGCDPFSVVHRKSSESM